MLPWVTPETLLHFAADCHLVIDGNYYDRERSSCVIGELRKR